MACEDQITPTDLTNAKDDAVTLAEIATSKSGGVSSGDRILSSTDRFGIDHLTSEGALARIPASPLNGGVWAAGVTFSAYNDYMIYSGVAYKPKQTTSLPYVSEAAPNVANVEPFLIGNAESVEITVDNVVSDVDAILNSRRTTNFTTLRNLDSSKLADGELIQVSGFSETWEVLTGTSSYDDNWRCIFNDDPNRYVECTSSTVNPRIFGAIGDGLNDDTIAMFNACERSKILQRECVVPKGQYVVNEFIISNNVRLRGEGYRRQDESTNGVTFIGTTGSFVVQSFDYRFGSGVEGYGIQNIKVVGSSTTQYGLILLGTDARVVDVVVDNVPNGVGIKIGYTWRSQFDSIKVTNCGLGVQLGDASDAQAINACVFNNLCIELCTVGMYAVKNNGATQAVANVFSGVVIEGIALSEDRTFPAFLTLNPYVSSEYGMTLATITGAFFCEQEFQAVFNGWYSENVEGIHVFTGYYCELQFNTAYFEIEKYAGDEVREYPMISSNQSPIQFYNARFLHDNLNDNAPFISINPGENNIFEGCKQAGTNTPRDFYYYHLDDTQSYKFYDGTYIQGRYESSTGILIKGGGQYNSTLVTVGRIAKYTNHTDYADVNVASLHGAIFEINNDVNKHYTLTGCNDENKTIEISMMNSHPTNSVVFYLFSDLGIETGWGTITTAGQAVALFSASGTVITYAITSGNSLGYFTKPSASSGAVVLSAAGEAALGTMANNYEIGVTATIDGVVQSEEVQNVGIDGYYHTENLANLFTATVPAKTARTLKVINLGGTWYPTQGGDTNLTV